MCERSTNRVDQSFDVRRIEKVFTHNKYMLQLLVLRVNFSASPAIKYPLYIYLHTYQSNNLHIPPHPQTSFTQASYPISSRISILIFFRSYPRSICQYIYSYLRVTTSNTTYWPLLSQIPDIFTFFLLHFS